MTNLSKFHIVCSSSALIHLNKLCQTVNNFVKQNKSTFLSRLRKRRPPQLIKHIRNTSVSCIPTFAELCSSMLHPLDLLLWVPDSGAIVHKSANQRNVSSLLKLLWAALQVATQKQKLGVSFVCHGCNMVDPSKSLLRVTPKYLASMTSSSTCHVSE